MMFIDIGELQAEASWFKEAEAALNEARTKANGKERSDFIKSNSHVWTKLKPKLEKLSHRKCWYCESREKRSDRSVDHYRPKNNVRDSNHNGYWWRAFLADNYRLSCTYCNSRRRDRQTGHPGGKGDYFPLWDESKRVLKESDDAECKYEDPLLLDPCKRTDIDLLWFSEDGRAVAKYGETEHPHAAKRAEVSIEYYHLNETEIKEARQGLCHEIRELIRDGDFHFLDSLNGNPNAERALSSTILKLEQLIQRDAEFSAFAKAIIAGSRKPGSEWLDTI
jgi:hypothetical protein